MPGIPYHAAIAHLTNNLHVTCLNPSRPERAIVHDSERSIHLVQISIADQVGGLVTLTVIQAFCETIGEAIKCHGDRDIVICPGSSGQTSVSTLVMICGAYLVLRESISVASVLDTMRRASKLMDAPVDLGDTSPCVLCWRALEHARTLQWLGLDTDEPQLDVEMAAHYALPANGNLHVLIPGKLLLFPTPARLPDGQDWADDRAGGRPPTRNLARAGHPAVRYRAGHATGTLVT